MLFPLHRPDPLPNGSEAGTEETTSRSHGLLPAVWRPCDLALIIVLITIIVPDMRGMQFAGSAVFFYWGLAFATFQIPSLYVFSWLMHQAPPDIPIYVWLLHLMHERWRSVLL